MLREQGDIQPEQREGLAKWGSYEAGKALLDLGGGETVRCAETIQILCCAGVCRKYPQSNAVGLAWAFFVENVGSRMVPITRRVRQYLHEQHRNFNRIEMICDPEFKIIPRWAKLIGMTLEHERLRGFGPEGEDQSLWARWRDG